MSTQLAVSTGIIYHSAKDVPFSYEVEADKDECVPSKVIKFCYGYNHMVLLKENGLIQPIATNDTFFAEAYKKLQSLHLPIVDIAFGKDHAIVLTSTNQIIAFGDNRYDTLLFKPLTFTFTLRQKPKQKSSFGQLGVGKIGHKLFPLRPGFLTYFLKVNQQIISIKCGAYHSVALSKSGDVYTWYTPFSSFIFFIMLHSHSPKIKGSRQIWPAGQ